MKNFVENEKVYLCYMLFEVGGLFVQKNLHNNLGLTVARFNHGLLKTRPYMSHPNAKNKEASYLKEVKEVRGLYDVLPGFVYKCFNYFSFSDTMSTHLQDNIKNILF